jgi:hypothetical protein
LSGALNGYVTILGQLDPEDEEITTLVTSQTVYPATQRKIPENMNLLNFVFNLYTRVLHVHPE